MIAGLYPLDGGGMILDNSEIVGAGTDRAVVFQSPNLLPWLTAIENVMLAVEQVMPRASLYIADEIFFTGTAAEITPVRSIDKIKIRV